MGTKHKHAELIKAWADGAEIEIYSKITNEWIGMPFPDWHIDMEYRIKPGQKPDVVIKLLVGVHAVLYSREAEYGNLKLTFDGETGKLKSAEVLE